jgi:hypothetical protein
MLIKRNKTSGDILACALCFSSSREFVFELWAFTFDIFLNVNLYNQIINLRRYLKHLFIHAKLYIYCGRLLMHRDLFLDSHIASLPQILCYSSLFYAWKILVTAPICSSYEHFTHTHTHTHTNDSARWTTKIKWWHLKTNNYLQN